MPHQFSGLGVFADDMSDHCIVGDVRDTKLPHSKARLILRGNMKHFREQAFLWDLFLSVVTFI